IIICTVSDAPQFAPAEREEEFYVCGSFTVEGQLFFIMVAVTHFIFFQSERRQPVQAETLPVVKPLQICIRFAEELQLHLLELPCTECKVTRRNLISEGFTDLSNTERQFLSGGTLHIFKVYKYTLGSLRAKIYGILRVLCYS